MLPLSSRPTATITPARTMPVPSSLTTHTSGATMRPTSQLTYRGTPHWHTTTAHHTPLQAGLPVPRANATAAAFDSGGKAGVGGRAAADRAPRLRPAGELTQTARS